MGGREVEGTALEMPRTMSPGGSNPSSSVFILNVARCPLKKIKKTTAKPIRKKTSPLQRELLYTVFFLAAVLLFPWLAFLLVRLVATVFEIHPTSITGHILSIFPNLVLAGLGIAFLVSDDWSLSAVGLHIRKLIPAILFIVLVLAGLYTIYPLGMAIFFEPRTLVVSFQGFSLTYLVLFLRSWVVVGISEEIAARGFLLNKIYTLFRPSMKPVLRKIWAVLFTLVFFSLVNYIRLTTAGNPEIPASTMIIYFAFGLLVSYLYIRTNNLFIAGFMQAALIFPPLGLIVGKEFALTDIGFIITSLIFAIFLIVLTETYAMWGKTLEFNTEDESDEEEQNEMNENEVPVETVE